MPELPEVETVRRGLLPVMEGRVIARADIRREGLRTAFPERMADRLTGARVDALRRRSKYILADLSTGETLIIHLGMSGRMTISTGDHPDLKKHDHVVLDMESGARVTFNDPRRFGLMDMFATNCLQAHPLLVNIGPEPLGNQFNDAVLIRALKGRSTPIKSALLDQKTVAGLGNIYVCEVLLRAGMNPKRKAGQISAKRAAALVPIIRDVLSEAIANGGSSLKDYRQADGELGYFQHAFRVYGREGEPCLSDGCGGKITRITQSGRSTFYCPQCQR
ncbi:MAG: bifunctional DNA-formamidopyrimidine glycosylase/DNA-(apurinic or apyrimidinic site) lyase [Rhodobacteraceae bacterium]|nr:bifunctional DNA-formamidopyrimidine glycosylase/DNA-(apurinic or apyrimidinic site) lyase [Paracoccaceae bacterium]